MIIDGNVYYAEKPEAKQTYALTVNAPSFVIEALSPGLGLKDAVTALGKVKGTIDKPEAEGTFGLDKLAYDRFILLRSAASFCIKTESLISVMLLVMFMLVRSMSMVRLILKPKTSNWKYRV